MAAPRKPYAERRSQYVVARLTPAEHRQIMAAAKVLKQPVADVIRAGLRLWCRQNGIKVLGQKD